MKSLGMEMGGVSYNKKIPLFSLEKSSELKEILVKWNDGR